MNVFELFATLSLDSSDYKSGLQEAESKGSNTASAIGKTLAAASAAVATGISALTTIATKAYGTYEQLVGGTELLFGDAYSFIMDKSANAYKTVQMSQNDYLTQVNGFAVGLKTALGGNEQAAAELADKIITAEADVVAATGASQEAVQNAFNGIMKSNYTMVDNLQLGITPTKEGFQEMIATVNEWNTAQGNATNYTIDNLADCQSALVDYIAMQGLAGYASNEAADTIQGSVASMKSAWENFVTGLGSSESDMGTLTDNLVASAETALDNIVPVVDNAITHIVDALPNVVDKVLPKLMSNVTKLLPTLTKSVTGILKSITTSLPQVVNGLVSELPTLVFSALTDVLPAIATAISDTFMNLPSMLGNLVTGIVDGFKSIFGKSYKAEDIFSETVLGNMSAFEDYCMDFTRECNKAIAQISGNVSWADALSALDNADALVDAVKKTWETFTQNYQSTEDVQFSVNATVTDAMVRVSELLNILGSDGTSYTGSSELVKAIVEEVNNIVGEDVLTYEDMPAVQAFINEIDTMISEGVTKESIIAEISNDVKELLGYTGEEGTGIALTPIPAEAEAVISMASVDWMNGTDVIEGESWDEFLIRKLTEAGFPDSVTQSVKAAINMNAGVKTAFTSANYSGATYDSIQAVLEEAMKNGTTIDPETGEVMVDTEAVAEVIFQLHSEGKTPEEIASYLDETFPKEGGETWSAEVVANVTGLEDAEALNTEIEKLIKNQILQSNMSYATQTNTEQRAQYKEAESTYEEAWSNYQNATTGSEKATWWAAANDALASMEAMQDKGDELYEDYVLNAYNMEQEVENMVSSYDDIPESVRSGYEAMRQAFQYGSEDLSIFNNELTNVDPREWEHVGDVLDGTAGIASQAGTRIGETISDLWEGLADGSINADEGVEAISEKLTGLQTMADNLSVSESDLSAFGISVGDLSKDSQELFKSGKLKWGELLNASELETNSELLKERWKAIFTTWQDNLEVPTDEIGEAGTEAVEALSNPIDSEDWNGLGSTSASGIKNGFSAYSGVWSPLGGNVVQGLTSGVNEEKPTAVLAMEKLAEEMKDKLKEVWGIASPSKVAKEMMGYIADGFVEQAESESGRVSSAIEGMVSSDVSADLNLRVANNNSNNDMISTLETLGNMGIYLDGNTLVGHTINRVDKALQNNRNKSSRGNVVFA